MWRTVKLGEILKTGAGGTPLKSQKTYYEGGTIKWLLSGAVCERDIHDSKTHITEDGLANSSAKLFPINTVLVAMYGATAGQVGILRTEAATNQAVCGIYPSEDYLPEFLYYYLTNYKETLLLEVSGVAQPNLSQVKIKNIPLPLISLAEQQRIVAKLDAAFAEVDRAIEVTSQKLEESSVLLKILLKSMFAAAGRTEKTFADVCTLKRGYDLPKKDRNPGKYPLYSANGVTDFIDEYKVSAPAVVTGRSGTIGEVHYSEQNIWALNTALYVKDFKGNLEKYIYYFLKSFDLKKYASGAGVPTLNRNFLSEETVHIDTDDALQIAVAEKMDGAYSAKEKLDRLLESKMEALVSLKSAILAQELQPPQSEAA